MAEVTAAERAALMAEFTNGRDQKWQKDVSVCGVVKSCSARPVNQTAHTIYADIATNRMRPRPLRRSERESVVQAR